MSGFFGQAGGLYLTLPVPTTVVPTTAPPDRVTAIDHLGTAQLTASASANTKGDWAQVIASTARAYCGLIVKIIGDAAGSFSLTDVGFGDTPDVKIANIPHSGTIVSAGTFSVAYFPIAVPAGTKISARTQATSGSKVPTITIEGVVGDKETCSVITTLGAVTASSAGTTIDPGGTADTKGAYVELTASLAVAGRWFGFGITGLNNTSRTACDWLMDIAIGAAGAEAPFITDFYLSCNAQTDLPLPQFYGADPLAVAAGSRIAARAQCTINDATDRLFGLILFVGS